MGYSKQNFYDMLEMDICPICKNDLTVSKITDKHGDNSTFNETHTKKYCKNHGNMDEIYYEDYKELSEKDD